MDNYKFIPEEQKRLVITAKHQPTLRMQWELMEEEGSYWNETSIATLELGGA